MAEHNFFVGQEFSDVKVFRNSIKEAAIAKHFELRVIKSDLIRYVAKCASEDCPWRIRAVKISNSSKFTIRSLEPTHTCGCNAQDRHHQASVDWIVSFIEERLRDNVNYKPKDILHDIQKQYGITIPYKQAWRAKERGLEAIYGSSEEGYFLLPSFCDLIKKSNPGSVAEVYTANTDNRFQHLFLSFYASIYGFLNGCLPIVGLGGFQLRNKYLGTLLSATSFDADGGLFPLAFAVVDVESDESWMWFLSELHKALEVNTLSMPQFTFLSNGTKGIVDALKKKFPSSFHAVCMRHLTENIGKEFKNPRLVHLLWKAAYATSIIDYKEKMSKIEDISSEAAKWLEQFHPHSWAIVHFDGIRYGHLSSNVEKFNEWIVEAHELPVVQVMEKIFKKLSAMFEERRSRSSSWTSKLAPSAEKRMAETINLASSYKVLRSDEVEFEVVSGDQSDIVNIGNHCCSCRYWQLYGIPCSHAVAALKSCKKDVYEFTVKYFTVESYRETYLPQLHPIPRKFELKRAAEALVKDEIQVVRPPKFRRPPGRPEKKRICVDHLNREKHTVHCSKCNQTGHYKTTCKALLAKRLEH